MNEEINEEFVDYEIENDLTDEMIAAQEALLVRPPYRVYFEKETGTILGITADVLPEHDFWFEASDEKLEKFLKGLDYVTNYRVVMDAESKFDLVLKVFKLDPKSSMLSTIPYSTEPAILTVINDINSKSWKIILNQDERKRLQHSTLSYPMQIYVTNQQNKNIMYRVLDISLDTLINSGVQIIPHESVFEELNSQLRLLTIKFFDSYALRINK
jgi:hypothetical protein